MRCAGPIAIKNEEVSIGKIAYARNRHQVGQNPTMESIPGSKLYGLDIESLDFTSFSTQSIDLNLNPWLHAQAY